MMNTSTPPSGDDRTPSSTEVVAMPVVIKTTPARLEPTHRSRTETEDERRWREEEESIQLARQLMAEEAVFSYQQHMQFLRETSHQLSREDYDALQAAINEDQEPEYEEDEYEDDEEEDLTYESMLHLGERIGDVRSERWSVIAKKEIDKLPSFQFAGSHSVAVNASKDSDDSEYKCLVCQCEYEHGETLRRLPCEHTFHLDCADQWLSTKDVCPYCRQSIIPE